MATKDLFWNQLRIDEKRMKLNVNLSDSDEKLNRFAMFNFSKIGSKIPIDKAVEEDRNVTSKKRKVPQWEKLEVKKVLANAGNLLRMGCEPKSEKERKSSKSNRIEKKEIGMSPLVVADLDEAKKVGCLASHLLPLLVKLCMERDETEKAALPKLLKESRPTESSSTLIVADARLDTVSTKAIETPILRRSSRLQEKNAKLKTKKDIN